MAKYLFLFLGIIISFNSCTTAYFIRKTQEVSIIRDSTVTILINDSIPRMINDKYILNRDGEPKLITLKKDGYKSTLKVINPYIFHPTTFVNIVFNAIVGGTVLAAVTKDNDTDAPPQLFGTLGTAWGGMFGYGITPFSANLINHEKKTDFSKVSLARIPVKDTLMKSVNFNNINIDIKPENYNHTLYTYHEYYKGKNGKPYVNKNVNPIKYKNSYISEFIQLKLKENGFVDTSGYALKYSYTHNTFINATITGFNINQIYTPIPLPATSSGFFINTELKIKWEMLDYYKNILYTDTINSKSGDFLNHFSPEFALLHSSKENELLFESLDEALENSLYSFMAKAKFREHLYLKLNDSTEKHKIITLKRVNRYVNSIEEAAEATVTIKTKDGHGSGIFISEDGYIVTNYHVVSKPEKLEIITSDGSKYLGKVIQTNKIADFALLKIEKRNIIPFNITDVPAITIGTDIYVIGTPSAEDLSQTLSRGIISSVRTHANGIKTIQFDASVNQGNSGGSLINKDGKLIGVVKSKMIGIGVEGISFALHADEIIKNLSLVFE